MTVYIVLLADSGKEMLQKIYTTEAKAEGYTQVMEKNLKDSEELHVLPMEVE